jgi:hypothetical protein
MGYTVSWLKGDTVLGTKSFDDLSPAKRYAREHFPIEKNRRGATTAEVRDEDGTIHFRHDDTQAQ